MTTSNEHFLIRSRNLRNELLKTTDYYLLNDVYEVLSDTQKQEIKDYRQSLRNFININRENYLDKGVAYLPFPKPPEWTKIQIPRY